MAYYNLIKKRVYVSTKKENDKVLIKVNDNGPGISQKVLDKISQPFSLQKLQGKGQV
jgi:C4-dicarboxylate-specific signal transduction histidine kinase